MAALVVQGHVVPSRRQQHAGVAGADPFQRKHVPCVVLVVVHRPFGGQKVKRRELEVLEATDIPGIAAPGGVVSGCRVAAALHPVLKVADPDPPRRRPMRGPGWRRPAR